MIDELIECLLWDIDSTVADRGTRGPFDYTKVMDDSVKEDIQTIYKILRKGTQAIKFIFLTGRPESCRADTEKWLYFYGFEYDELIMRPDDCKDNNAIFKMNAYKKFIKDKYKVIAVFEDSVRAAQMYREILKITCILVDDNKY